MTEPDACDKFLHRISPAIFSEPNDKIVEAICDLHDEREKVNLLTVSNRLSEKRVLAACGDRAGITAISTETTSEAIAESALDCILDEYCQRQAAKIGKQLHIGEIGLVEAEKQLAELNRRTATIEPEKCLTVLTPDEILARPRDDHSCFLGDRLFAKGQSLVIVGIGGSGKNTAA